MAGNICKICFGFARYNHKYCDKCKKLCVRCRERNAIGNQSMCKQCMAEYRRYYRSIHSGNNYIKKRNSLRCLVNRKIKQGIIKRTPCKILGCNEKETFIFFPDLNNWESVIFLCRSHHRKASAKQSELEYEKIYGDCGEDERSSYLSSSLG